MSTEKIHTTAASYQSASEIYESGRPGYTEESVFTLCENLRLKSDSSVIELGAGTGKFTRVLVKRYPNILAIEPVPAMLEKLQSLLPGTHAKLGMGEEIPSENFSADAILIANAFHWFSTEKALSEFNRVLKVGGGLGLIWNLDGVFTSTWGKIIDSWLDEMEGETPQYKTGKWRKILEKTEIFSPLSEQLFSSIRTTTPNEVLHRVLSISFVAAQPKHIQTELRQRIEHLLATHSETRNKESLTVSFDTKIYWCFKN